MTEQTCPHSGGQTNHDEGTDRVLRCDDCGQELARTRRGPDLD